jgi:hypothetical protein
MPVIRRIHSKRMSVGWGRLSRSSPGSLWNHNGFRDPNTRADEDELCAMSRRLRDRFTGRLFVEYSLSFDRQQ